MAQTMTDPRLYLPSDVMPPDMASDQQMTALPPPVHMAAAAPKSAPKVDPRDAMTVPLLPPHDAMQAMSTPPPTVTMSQNPLEQQEGHAQNRLMADERKDADPYGSADNHPGILGKFLHGLNVATGGVNRRQWEEQELGKQIQGLEAEKSKEGLEGATAGHLNEETSEMPDKTQSEEDLQGATAGNLKAETAEKQQALDMGPSLVMGHAHAVNKALTEGRDPADDPLVQGYEKAIQSLQKQPAEKTANPKTDLQTQLIAAENSGDTATAKKLKGQIKDLDPNAEQRIVIQQQNAANANNRQTDAATEREYTYARGKWDKDLQTYNSQNEKLQEANSFIGKGALGDALGAIKSLSGLASGQGSGVRITQAELNSIAHARGLGGDFQAALQKFGDGRNLTPQQEVQLKGILSSVQHVAQIKEQIINQGLDDLSNAKDKATVRKIDSQLRHALMGGQ